MVIESYTDVLRTKIMVLTMQAKSINDFLNDDIQAEENHCDHMAKSLEVIRQTVKILKFARENSIVHRERSTNNSRNGSVNHSFAYSKFNDNKLKDDLNATMNSGISGPSAGKTPARGIGLRNRLGSDPHNILPPATQKPIKSHNKTESTTPTSIIIQNNINKLNYLIPNKDGMKITSDRVIKRPPIHTETASARLVNLLSASSPTDPKYKNPETKQNMNTSLPETSIRKRNFDTKTHTIEPTLEFNIPKTQGQPLSAKSPANDLQFKSRGVSKDEISKKIEEFKKEVKANIKGQVPVNTNESILTDKSSNFDFYPEKQVSDHVGQLQNILSNMNNSVSKVIDNRRSSPAPMDLKKTISSGPKTVIMRKDSPNKLSPPKTIVSDAKKNFKDLMSMQATPTISLTSIKPPRPNMRALRSPK